MIRSKTFSLGVVGNRTRSTIVLVGYWALSGCTTQFSTGMQSVPRLELTHGPTRGDFMLIDSSNRLISTGRAASTGLVFEIPGKYRVDGCAALVDTKRKSATDHPYVFLSLRSEYQKLLEQRLAAAAVAEDSRNRSDALRRDAQETEVRLSSNRAFTN